MSVVSVGALVAHLLCANLGFDAFTQERSHISRRCPTPQSRFSKPCSTTSTLFEFASSASTPAYAGLPTAGLLCDQLAAGEKLGNWWCLKADGNMATGSVVTLTSTGSPTIATTGVCPSGPACDSAVTRIIYDAVGDYHASAIVDKPSGAWTLCLLLNFGSAVQNPTNWVTHNTGAVGPSIQLQSGSSAPAISVLTNNSVRLSNIILTPGAWHLVCATSNAAQNSGQAYLDGAAYGATYNSALGSGTNQFWRVSGRGDGTYPIGKWHQVRGSFLVEAELSAARIAAIASAVLATPPTSADGGVLTYARTGPEGCCVDLPDCQLMSILPPNRPCITNNKMQLYRGSSNLLGYSEKLQLGVNVWSFLNTPTVTANNYAAPMGGVNAVKWVDNSATLFEGKYQTFSTTSQTYHTFSVWTGCDTGSCETSMTIVGTGNSAGDTTCNFPLVAAWKRVSCTTAAPYGAGLSAITATLRVGDAASDQYSVGFWGAQYEVNATYASPYMPTDQDAVDATPRGAASAYFTMTTPQLPASMSAAISRSTTPPTAGGSSYLMARTGASDYLAARSTLAATTTLVCAANAVTQTQTTLDGTDQIACYASGAGVSACIGGTCAAETGTPAVSTSGSALYLGYDPDNASWVMDGLIGEVCVSSSATRCR